jgi:hypothetical protein
VRENLIQCGRDPKHRVWRRPSNKNSSDEEHEEEFKVPTKQ